LVSNRSMPQHLLESNRNVINDLETGELYGRRIGPQLGGHEAVHDQRTAQSCPARNWQQQMEPPPHRVRTIDTSPGNLSKIHHDA
jgi:hypothetical protein